MRTPRASAFTLIELVIVIAVIGILAVLAIGTRIGNQPRTRLVASASEIRLTLMQARTAAVRSGANHKVCVFKDVSTTALPASGRVLVFQCGLAGVGTPGLASCPGTTICNNVDAADATLFTAALADCTAQNWCPVNDINGLKEINLGAGSKLDENVSINRFLDTGGADTTRNSIELTYLPNGILDRIRSSNVSGSIELVNHDQCLPTIAACSSFQNAMRVSFNTGGGARLSE